MTALDDILNSLNISLCNIHDERKMSAAFAKIASVLFKDYGVECGSIFYHFAEMEFYYYRKGEFEYPWNTITYPRDKENGEFFYHLSGVDICFESRSSKENAEFGGIIIRSLAILSEGCEKNVVFGPLTCKNEMLNHCHREMPTLRKSAKPYDCIVSQTSLAGIQDSDKQRNHCFYDSSIPANKWTRTIDKYDYKKRGQAPYTTKYDTSRFDL